MKDLMRLGGTYQRKNWTDAKRDEVLSEFIDIIQAHILAGFVIGFNAKDFRARPSEEKKKLGDPKMFCFQRLLKRVCDKLKALGYEATVSAIFDDHQKYSRECYSHWSALRTQHPNLKHSIPCIAFADDEIFLPLQTADIISWLSNRWLRDGRDETKLSRHFQELIKCRKTGRVFPFESELWDKRELDRVLPTLGEGRTWQSFGGENT
jgi:hypothetical protein